MFSTSPLGIFTAMVIVLAPGPGWAATVGAGDETAASTGFFWVCGVSAASAAVLVESESARTKSDLRIMIFSLSSGRFDEHSERLRVAVAGFHLQDGAVFGRHTGDGHQSVAAHRRRRERSGEWYRLRSRRRNRV